MKYVLILTSTLLLASFFRQEDAEDTVVLSFGDKIDGRTFEWEVEEAHIDDAPVWKDGAACPPVPPRQALSISEAALKHYVNRGLIRRSNADAKWNLQDLSLRTVWDGWLWVVHFESHGTADTPGFSGISSQACVVILMDGKVLFPKREVPQIEDINK